jgi:hypothetical protein
VSNGSQENSARIYLDHNVVDEISKGRFRLPVEAPFSWVYSNEHFNEIDRAGDRRFLDVLANLRAQKLEFQVDQSSRISGMTVRQGDPRELFEMWRSANASVDVDVGGLFLPIISRVCGAANVDAISEVPESFERELAALLRSIDAWDDASATRLAKLKNDMQNMVENFASIPRLEKQREAFEMHEGRGSELNKHHNPLQALAEKLAKLAPGVTADRWLGFDPPDKGAYEEWPLYLGIVGCYTMLNIIGLRPDKGLSDVDRMPAILSDASHVGYGAYCNVLMSADQRLCDKAKAIYKYKNIGTVVARVQLQN